MTRTFSDQEILELETSRAMTPRQRLAWLEEARAFVEEAERCRRAREEKESRE